MAVSRRRRCVQSRRCDGATLPTWLATSFSRRLWNAPPRRDGNIRVAIPAELQDRRLVARKIERPSRDRRRWRWHERRARSRSAPGPVWRTRGRAATRLRRASDRYRQGSRRLPPAASGASRSACRPRPAPTTVTWPKGTRAGVPHRVQRSVSMFAASTARDAGTSGGTGTAAAKGTSNTVWCGCNAKDRASHEVGRSVLDGADDGVAVFDREREIARHEGRPACAHIRRAAPDHGRPAIRCRG